MLNQSQRILSAYTNPLTLFGGGFDHPQTFFSANQKAPFGHVIFALDQSERFILQLTNHRPS